MREFGFRGIEVSRVENNVFMSRPSPALNPAEPSASSNLELQSPVLDQLKVKFQVISSNFLKGKQVV